MFDSKRAAIFIRSALYDAQRLVAQEHSCRRFAESRGYEIIEVIGDTGSACGVSIQEQPAMQQLFKLAMDGGIDAAICWDKSRLVRNLADEIIVTEIFKKSNCEMLFAYPNEHLTYGDDDLVQLFRVLQTWRHQAEVKKQTNEEAGKGEHGR